MSQKFPMVAKTFKGLEDVLRDELIDLGAENVQIGLRMVSFEGDLEMMYRANFCCRTALFVLKPVESFIASNPDELYDAVRDIDWTRYLGPDSTFAIDSTVHSAEFPHSKYVVYRVKDGIVDFFNDRFGKRPSIRLSGADVLFNVHISDRRVTISLNSSGEPLNQRGYRVEQTQAPLNEVLAAGIILKTGWRGGCDFVDPMCGSGTFLIEAALIARNIPPGVFRRSFAFERWADFDRDLFEKVYNDDSRERKFEHKIYGGDKDPLAVAIARRNIRQAASEDCIEVVCKPFEDWTEPPKEGILVTNPPYGERLKPEHIGDLYHDLGSTLKHYFKGYHAWILGYQEDHFSAIGLRPSVKFPILNGSLECSLREYVLFDGTMADFKTAGGRTDNPDFKRPEKPDFKNRKPLKPFRSSKPERQERGGKTDRPEKSFRSDKPFKSGKYERSEKPFRAYRPFQKKNKPAKGAIETPDRGPKIDESRTVRFSDKLMRSRKGWRKRDDEESQNH